ncbi:hypothetical protein PYCC9005_002852 [Savitreella phatthalungensis]
MQLSGLTPLADSCIRDAAAFKSNEQSWSALLKELDQKTSYSRGQGAQIYLDRHVQRGMLLARDRISLLLDEDSPWLELLPFAGLDLPDEPPCANLIAGIGRVSNQIVLVLSHIPTINGGAWSEHMVKKQVRVMEIATENRLPVVALVQSAGVFLPNQFKIFHPGGQIFHDLVNHSLQGLGSCSIVFGSGTAGGAYQPGLSSHAIYVERQAQVFLGGPPLVKMATGEEISSEELGGASMHSKISGVSDELAMTEFDAIAKAREWVTSLALTQVARQKSFVPPRLSEADLLGLVSTNLKTPFDMLQVIARLVDDSRVALFKPAYGVNLVCASAQIRGHNVAFIANNNGVLYNAESDKAVQFIMACNVRQVPIVFLHNVTGFMVGSKTERSGLIKAGSRHVGAIVASTVPHISIICGASYGAGNYAMCGRSYRPRFLFSWPNSRCSVMGAQQLSGVLSTIARSSAKSKGATVDEEQVLKREEQFRQRVEQDGSVYRTSAALLDDGIIDPRDTREVLGICLDVVTKDGVNGDPGMRGVSRM